MTRPAKCYFIAGTDTDVGKTLVAAGLLALANRQGLETLAIKPVAAGCQDTAQGLRNEDALALMAQMSVQLCYEQVNPIALRPPIAPHIAAQQSGITLSLQPLISHCREMLDQFDGFALIEGAGGWRLPLNETEYLSGLAQALNVPVILVVGMKLGCLNHALLTVEAIVRDGVSLAGWVANQIDPDMMCFEENLQTLKTQIKAPLLGVVPRLQQLDEGASVILKGLTANYLCIDALH